MRAAVVTAALLIMSCGAPKYPPCPPGAPCANGKMTELGAVAVTLAGDAAFVDLRSPDPTRPLLRQGGCRGCGLAKGKSYRARLADDGTIYSMLVGGREIRRPCDGQDTGPCLLFDAYPILTCPETGPGHWEWKHRSAPDAQDWGWHCFPGARAWTASKRTPDPDLPDCAPHGPYANQALTAVINVRTPDNKQWIDDLAPVELAQRILGALNQNVVGLVFTEASGVVPQVVVEVTFDETLSGTPRYSGTASVSGFGEAGVLFSVASGEAPYTQADAAIDQLSANVRTFFVEGWHHPLPCRMIDGYVWKA